MFGSYYAVTPDMYQPPPAGTPGWQMAPVPGWGINPWRAGPARVGMGLLGENNGTGTGGIGIVVAGVAIGALLLYAALSPLAKA